MRAEGECPECGSTVGVQIGGSVSGMVGRSTIERLMERRGNGMYCQECGEYVEPDVDIIEDH